MMEVLLLDLDGVLLNSAGYHRSLVETVRRVSQVLGFGDATLSPQDIEAFELRDITAEWDSSAIVAALLLVEAWRTDPSASLPRRPPLEARPAVNRPFAAVRSFLADLDGTVGVDPLAQAESLLMRRLDGVSFEQRLAVRSILRGARDLNDSLTFWLVQLFNLGGRRFEAVYRLPAGLETESFLETYDLPTLTADERAALLNWIDRPESAAAIMTNRPCTSPEGIFNTPEAEIGRHASGFDPLPMVAAGDLGWRAQALGLDPQAFLKPSPVHALAAALRAIGEGEPGIESAIRLAQSGEMQPAVRRLQDARVLVFEDAPKGHSAALAAVELLRKHGVRIHLELYGIAPGRERAQVLSGLGARVYPDVRLALDAALPRWRVR